jgi:acetyltransferase
MIALTPPAITEKPREAHARELRNPLEPLFSPRTLAVIGASETPGSVGYGVWKNLAGFDGAVYPVNPNHQSILGIQAFPKITAVPESIDLAVIVTPAGTVPRVIRECIQADVPAGIIMSAGFRECGAEGAKLEAELLEELRKGKMRVVGPNCLGVMVPLAGLNATFAATMATPGNVGFVSQSGALCSAILDWSLHENVGFSAFVSIGAMLDVGWGDLIYYLGDDPRTKSIVIYMETIGNARAFLSAAREVALSKPIIVLKVGKTQEAAKAAASHTGSLTGSDEVLGAAFRRAGVLRVNSIEELFDMAEVLGKQPRPRGPRLAIVSNAGGPGVLATDTLVTSGEQLAELSVETSRALDQVLPPAWSHNNPVDILGDAGPERFERAVEIVAKDPANDALLVILTPQSMSDPTVTAQQLKRYAQLNSKPILASWMGANQIEAGEEILNRASIPTFRYPDQAARAFHYMWRYSDNLRTLYETPEPLGDATDASARRERAEAIIRRAREGNGTILTEFRSKQLLQCYGIPTVPTRVAFTADQAVKYAQKMRYPVVLKLYSETITHKTDVGGVHLNLRDAVEVKRAWKLMEASVRAKAGPGQFLGATVQKMIAPEGYELIIGSTIDAQFGPVLLFGHGGQLVEILKDHALALPPLSATLARLLMERTHIYDALRGTRGRRPINLMALEGVLVRFGQLVVEQPGICEIEINPLFAGPEGLIALDARVLLHDKNLAPEDLPKPAIRPYPTQYVTSWRLANGARITLRPIRPEDEPLMVKFHATLSDQSVYYRYFTVMSLNQRIAHERLTRICFNDYDREIALVADLTESKTRQHQILAVGRLTKAHSTNEAELALLVSDHWQNHGIGAELLKLLVQIGRQEKLSRLFGNLLSGNRAMLHLFQKAGFRVEAQDEPSEYRAELLL